MTRAGEQPPSETDVAGLVARRDALRHAAGMPGARLRPTLEAALAELDAAVDALTAVTGSGTEPDGDQSAGAQQAERRLLRAMFTDAPVPLFLLGPDGTVRRVNRAAGELLGTGTGYATGKAFTAFVDLPARAAVTTHLAAVARTGKGAQVRCDLLTSNGPKVCELTVALASPPGDADHVIVAVSHPSGQRNGSARTAATRKGPPAATKALGAPVLAAITRRLDLVTTATRLLLANVTVDEAVTLQQFAGLLAEALSAWVIVDMARGQRLRRQFVQGPQDQPSAELARAVAACDPSPGSAPHAVHETGSSRLMAHAEDAGTLGDGPGGVPLLMLLGATSVLSVPLSDGEQRYGVLTLARRASDGHFEIADLGLMEELATQVALAIKVERMVRRHNQVADALRASLLPRTLPAIAGVEMATSHLPATTIPEVGGDFFDVHRTTSGWGTAIGDVCGRGEGVAGVSAAARHAIRLAARGAADPAAALTSANEVLLEEEFGGRFVTAAAAHLQWHDQVLRVTLASAGHPPPVLLHPDGRAQRISGGGLPLGIFADADTSLETIELAAGDVLVFFTDGLTDARGNGHGSFDDRLIGELSALAGQPPSRIVSRLQELVLEFCAGECRDDVTVLALRASEPPG